MTIVMPHVVQTPTPNYTPTLIKHDLFVLHDQEGHTLPSVSWLCNPEAKASAQICQSEDGDTLYQLCPLSMKAWHAVEFNSRGIGFEMPGFANRGFPDDLLGKAALFAAWYCRAYSVPVVWAQGGNGRGLCCHHDLGPAGGGHVDVGPIGGPAWQRFIDFTRTAYDDLGKLSSLPTIALNGLPGPHEVSPTPDVAGAPSHGGAVRSEPGDDHVHPTPSGFAAHSIAALQDDLNALGMTPSLSVDGWFGKNTQAALRAFQTVHGLVADGLIGPASWQVIDTALAA